jgi:hypothetical protein
MPMLVMHVRHVLMAVDDRSMPMFMGVGLARRIVRSMRMLMMLVVGVRVGLSHWLVDVNVLVILAEVKPYPETHQGARADELQRDRLAEYEDGGSRAEEGGGRKIRSRSCRSEMA